MARPSRRAGDRPPFIRRLFAQDGARDHEVGAHSETAERHHLRRRGCSRSRPRRASARPMRSLRRRRAAPPIRGPSPCNWASASQKSSICPRTRARSMSAIPQIANAIVRSARRIYISGVSNGQTTIFAIREGRRKNRRVPTFGRPRGKRIVEPSSTPPFRETISTSVRSTNTIILTGSVASAAEAQKALDIASGFVNYVASLLPGNIRVCSLRVGRERRLRLFRRSVGRGKRQLQSRMRQAVSIR